MIFKSAFILSFFIVEIFVFMFAFLALFFAVKITLKFDPDSLTQAQYKLANQSYLVSTVVYFIFLIKIPLFLFFIFCADEIAPLIPGAMCAVGVFDATNYGSAMLAVKILNLFFLCGFLYINFLDFKDKNSSFTKLKFLLFIVIFALFALELILEIMHFKGISFNQTVTCCSEVFRENYIGHTPIYYKNGFILSAFYVSFLILIVSIYLRLRYIFGFFSFVFFFACIYALIRFFSPYIYELPLHKCPFCMLSGEYHYIGYFIYILLFCGALPGFIAVISKVLKQKIDDFWFKISLICNVLLVAFLSYFPLVYRLKHGVWL